MKTLLVIVLLLASTATANDYQPALVIPESTLRLRLVQWQNYAGLFRYDPVSYAYVNGKISVYQELIALLPPMPTEPSTP